jgi:AP-2 complex subunit sigma-1
VYRRYAGLYFIFCVDPTDNELAALEGIHNFVEMLDIYFHNVCELDLVFNFYKARCCCLISLSLIFSDICSFLFEQVFAVLDEFCLAGEIMETNKRVVIEKMDELDKLD